MIDRKKMKQISIQINRQTGQQTDRLFILLIDRLQYELIGERLDPLTHKKIPHHTQIIEKEYNYFKRGWQTYRQAETECYRQKNEANRHTDQ